MSNGFKRRRQRRSSGTLNPHRVSRSLNETSRCWIMDVEPTLNP